MPVTFYWDGEPSVAAGCTSADMCIAASGYDKPTVAFGHTTYAHVANGMCLPQTWPNEQLLAESVEDRPVDIVYRSSNCKGKREEMAKLFRKEAEARGMTFEARGKCGAGGPTTASKDPNGCVTCAPNHPNRFKEPNVVPCNDCLESKAVLAFENFGNSPYLSEKLFWPLNNGSLAVYYGNGQDAMDKIGLNRDKMMDRASYASDAEFVNDVLDVIQSDRLQELVAQANFTGDPCSFATFDSEFRAVAAMSPAVSALMQSTECKEGLKVRADGKFFNREKSGQAVTVESIMGSLGCTVKEFVKTDEDVRFVGRFH
jgi:hypothetical protein